MGIYNIRGPSFTHNWFSGRPSNASSFSRFPFSLPVGQNHNLDNFVLQKPLQNWLVSSFNSFDNNKKSVVYDAKRLGYITPFVVVHPINKNTCFSVKDWHTNGLGVNPISFKRSADKASKVNHWTVEEDRHLEKLVKKHGENKWTMIAQCLGNRVGNQCRERWRNHLKENFKKNVEWTKAEEAIVIAKHMKGERWASISKELSGRPENAIKNHFNATKRKLQGTKPQPALTPFEHYIADFVKSTKYGPKEDQNDAAESHAQVLLWLNFDNCIHEEMTFAKNNFGATS